MPITKLRPEFTFTQDRVDALRAIAPEAFADGKINRDALLETLGEYLEEDDQEAEHFGLFWPGKRQARRLASQPSAGALRPAPGEGVNEETTRHIFIEGDNLQVLKLLQKSYAGRVKMIYIDPPYNTGNDFIYSDNFTQPVEEYLRATGQADEMGRVLVTNTQAGGRYHSNWLNMMYPRLRLARNLLADQGMIFVSIDDSELHHLRSIMNEVFGEENFIANIAWEKRYTRSNNAKLFYSLKDSLLVYRTSVAISTLREGRTEKSDSIYGNPDNDPRGPWTSSSYVNPATKQQRPNLVYTIVNPFTGERVEHPTHAWKYERSEHERHVRENRLWWARDGNAKYPRLKVFLSESTEGLVPIDLWDHQTSGTTDEGGQELKDLFGGAIFDNPKPTRLIARMLHLGTASTNDDIVMDFFSGSCTTAQAILQLNREDGGNRRFIMVQLPEPTTVESLAHRSGFATIADIGKERIRRVIQRMQAEDAGKLTTGRDTPEDLGFRVYKLDRSHYKAWRDFEGGEVADLQTIFDRFESPLAEGWKPEDVLTEVMLMEGFPLDSTAEVLPEFTSNTVTRVSSDLVAHRLFVCLDEKVHDETIAALTLGDDDIFICLDSALSDEAKVRLEDGRRVKVI